MKIFLNILLLIVFTHILNIRTDGYFPFTSTSDQSLLYLSSLLVVIFAFFILVITIKRFEIPLLSRVFKSNKSLTAISIITILVNNLIYTILTIRNFNNYHGESSLNIPILTISVLMISLITVVSYLSKNTKNIVCSIILSLIVLSAIQIIYFPITSAQGDLMPIIIEQGKAFLRGENIYQFYLLDNGVWTQAVRQPGNVLFYLPAIIFAIDPRILNILFILITVLILLKLVYRSYRDLIFDQRFLISILLISIFLFFPYRLIRADLYEPPFWMLITASIYFIKTQNFRVSSIIWGIGIFTQVWFWLFTPFYLLYLVKTIGFKRSLVHTLVVLSVGLGLLSIFVLRSPQDYYYHVFGYYNEVIKDGISYMNNYYLTPLFQSIGIRHLLSVCQFGSIAIVGFSAIKYMKNFSTFIFYLIISFLLFIQFNSLTWNYFYFNFVLLLIIYLLINLDD